MIVRGFLYRTCIINADERLQAGASLIGVLNLGVMFHGRSTQKGI